MDEMKKYIFDCVIIVLGCVISCIFYVIAYIHTKVYKNSKGLTLLDLIIVILVLSIIGGFILTFKSCTDHLLSNYSHIEYCMKG